MSKLVWKWRTSILTVILSQYPLVTFADDLPSTLSNARDQFVNYINWVANSSGVAPTQQLVLNSFILPLDATTTTPYYNDELFRGYADSTFIGGLKELQQSTPAGQAERFSFQYKTLVEQAAYQVDQNHPEIANTLKELGQQLDEATTALNKKITDLDQSWSTIAAARGLKVGTNEYALEEITWQGQIHYRDQISTISKKVTSIVSQINAARRKVYTPSERALLDNIDFLADAYDMARPWYAYLEVEQRNAGNPVSSVMLNDAHTLNPGMFDIAPLILPHGDISVFLTAKAGAHGFNTGSQSYQLTQQQKSWGASGGIGWGGWSIGGSGGGSSSYKNEISTLKSIDVHFDNIAEYKIDRGGWFQPGVLRDPNIQKLLKGRPEFDNLHYIAVSLILVRGTSITLSFSQSVNSSSWSQSGISGAGGFTVMGFGFSLGGSGSSSSYSVSNNANWTTVAFTDAPSTVRLIGVRVEPFIGNVVSKPAVATDASVVHADPSFKATVEKFEKGEMNYIDFQNEKVKELNKLLANPQ